MLIACINMTHAAALCASCTRTALSESGRGVSCLAPAVNVDQSVLTVLLSAGSSGSEKCCSRQETNSWLGQAPQ